MGVFGLQTYCLQHKDSCVTNTDLIEVSRQRDGIEILVDFYSFFQFLRDKFWRSVCMIYNNEFIKITGGEYAYVDAYVTKIISDLSSSGIMLIFYVDGAKGSSVTTTRNKFETWVNRHNRDLGNVAGIIDVCSGTKDPHSLSESSFIRPVLFEVQILDTLSKCKCDVIQVCAGEADPALAKELCERPKAYCILSNDTDFCVVRNCKVIPNELFDLENDLRLGEALLIPEKPSKLICGVISSSDVAHSLGIRNHFLLVELALVCGNDATSPYMKKLKPKIGIRGDFKDPKNVAGWVMHHKKIENHPVIADELCGNVQFQEAIHISRLFYEAQHPSEKPVEKAPHSQHIIECVSQGKYPPHIFAMHHNFYWHRMLVEVMTPGHPCVEVALSELRGFVYWMLLNRNEAFIMEYGRTPNKQFEALRVYKVQEPTHFRLLPIHHIKSERVFDNLRLFHNIMSHMEPEGMKWFDRYGRKNGFLCYVLRYMLILNLDQNLFIQRDEFFSLIATVFAHVHAHDNECLGLPLRPPVRCVTIGNWFQDVYRHAYHFLGKLLHLTHEFPTPKELFSGSLWTAFYVLAREQVYSCCTIQPPAELLDRIWNHRQSIIKEKRHMIRYLVKDIYEFDDRW